MNIFSRGTFYISAFKDAGRLTLSWRGFSLHFFVYYAFQTWGYAEDWYDGPLPSYGLGPLFLFTYMYSLKESFELKDE